MIAFVTRREPKISITSETVSSLPHSHTGVLPTTTKPKIFFNKNKRFRQNNLNADKETNKHTYTVTH